MGAINDWAIGLLTGGGYWAIALLMALENIVPPIPSELIMGLAGIGAGQGKLSLPLVILVGTLGSVAGNLPWYWLGHVYGVERLQGFVRRYGRWLTLDWHHVERINRLFHRHGGWVVFVLRFMPAFRTIVSLPAGLFGMPLWRFLLATLAGAAIWNGALAFGGYWLGQRITGIDRYLGPITWAAVGLLVVAYLWRVLTWRPEPEPADRAAAS